MPTFLARRSYGYELEGTVARERTAVVRRTPPAPLATTL